MNIETFTRRAARLAGCAALTVGSLATALLTTAAPAQADSWVHGCTGYNPVSCVDATTGGKNTSNHTQWVGWVASRCSGGNPCAGITKMEAWGDGFYFATGMNPKTVNPSAQWGAQRWVRSGTNVCAAQTDTSGQRSVECIHISV